LCTYCLVVYNVVIFLRGMDVRLSCLIKRTVVQLLSSSS